MLRSRRLAFAAAAVLLGLSACGDANSTTTAGKAPVVIHIGAGGANDAAGGGKAESAAVDRMMMPFQDITYVYDGTFPDLGAAGQAWSLPAGATPDLARVRKIAALLGVEGDIRELPADQGGGWMIGAADYSTATLTVSTDGMLSWWFNPTPVPYTGVGCATPASGGGSSGTDVGAAPDTVLPIDTVPMKDPAPCDVPLPPANVPTKDAALATATQLFADMGYDVAALDYEAYADEWSANVTAYLLLDGHRSPMSMSVGFGENGAITWASGALATPQPVADYPLVSGDEAVQRLNDKTGRWQWFGGMPGVMRAAMDTVGGGAAEPAIATDEAVAPPDTSLVHPTPITQPVCDPAADCITEPDVPQAITVHLSSMRLDVTTVWAEDGSIWLLPAYTFTSTDDGQYTIVAVDEQFLDMPQPTPVDTVPVDTAPVDTTPVPIDTTPVDTVPGDPTAPVMTVDDAAVLVGLPLDEASKVAEENGWTVRVSTLDGVSQILTADYQTNRVNLAVQDGAVVGIDSLG